MAATTGSMVARMAAWPASSCCRPRIYNMLGNTQLISPMPRIPPQTILSLNKGALAARPDRGRVKAEAKRKHQRLTVRAEYFLVAGLPKMLYSA